MNFLFTFFCALPPLAQDIKEMQMFLKDPKFYDLLGSGERIEEIVHNDEGYLVSTTRKSLQVHVQYQQTGRIGPSEFTLDYELLSR